MEKRHPIFVLVVLRLQITHVLVHKSELHRIRETFEPRTSESMRSVLKLASQATSKTGKEKILQDYGLHDIEVTRLY